VLSLIIEHVRLASLTRSEKEALGSPSRRLLLRRHSLGVVSTTVVFRSGACR
jgi:hypothetical protein